MNHKEALARCDVRTMHECSCEAHECRARHLGTWQKPRVQEIGQDTFRSQELIVIGPLMLVIVFLATCAYGWAV